MKNFSAIERVVGNISEAEKEKRLHEKGERFKDQFFVDLQKQEREKTPEEIIILSLVNEKTNELRKTYGLPIFNIPAQNVHVIKKEEWPEEKPSALYKSMLQAVAVKEQSAKLVFTEKVLHEMLHFKSYGAMQVTTDKKEDEYRLGLTVTKRDGSRHYFKNMNEAVTEELTMRLFFELSDHPMFAEEIRQTTEIAEKAKDELSVEGERLFTEDTYFAEIEDVGSGKARISIEHFSYPQERRILKKLIRKLCERNPAGSKDEQAVFELFASSMLSGDIRPIGRLIDSTFPIGTFREIGKLDDQIDEQELFIDSL
jgi:hypothetical protein